MNSRHYSKVMHFCDHCATDADRCADCYYTSCMIKPSEFTDPGMEDDKLSNMAKVIDFSIKYIDASFGATDD